MEQNTFTPIDLLGYASDAMVNEATKNNEEIPSLDEIRKKFADWWKEYWSQHIDWLNGLNLEDDSKHSLQASALETIDLIKKTRLRIVDAKTDIISGKAKNISLPVNFDNWDSVLTINWESIDLSNDIDFSYGAEKYLVLVTLLKSIENIDSEVQSKIIKKILFSVKKEENDIIFYNQWMDAKYKLSDSQLTNMQDPENEDGDKNEPSDTESIALLYSIRESDLSDEEKSSLCEQILEIQKDNYEYTIKFINWQRYEVKDSTMTKEVAGSFWQNYESKLFQSLIVEEIILRWNSARRIGYCSFNIEDNNDIVFASDRTIMRFHHNNMSSPILESSETWEKAMQHLFTAVNMLNDSKIKLLFESSFIRTNFRKNLLNSISDVIDIQIK